MLYYIILDQNTFLMFPSTESHFVKQLSQSSESLGQKHESSPTGWAGWFWSQPALLNKSTKRSIISFLKRNYYYTAELQNCTQHSIFDMFSHCGFQHNNAKLSNNDSMVTIYMRRGPVMFPDTALFPQLLQLTFWKYIGRFSNITMLSWES
jgi:hypothetical protein